MTLFGRAVGKTVFFAGTLALLAFSAVGQNCFCPPVNSCGECAGGVTALTLGYTGNTTTFVTIYDQFTLVFSGTVNPGGAFLVTSSVPGEAFSGSFLEAQLDGQFYDQIYVLCGSIAIGNSYGDFQIKAVRSKTGGDLCCPVEELETIKPVITSCPTDFSISLPSNACTVSVTWDEPLATDNCGNVTLSVDAVRGGNYTVGARPITYTATDKYGNQSTCGFTVTVIDDTSPVFTSCPSNIVVSANSNCSATASWSNPVAQDNCSANISGTHTSGSVFPLGVTTVTYTATDPSGNQSTCSFTVTVVDNTPPSFNSCPPNRTLNAAGGCSRIVSWGMPVVQDNCSVTVTASHIPGASFPVGVTTVTYTATDQNGNQATCSFTVTILDNTNPVFTNCPTNIELTASTTCTAVATWTPPTAQDNCSVNVTTSHPPGTAFPIGETIVTYTATDPGGNTATCSFTVTVNNTQLPILENCPDDLVVDADESNTAIVTWEEPEFSIVCGELTITQSHESGDAFPEGVTQVVYTAKNEAGDEVVCRFTVTVNRKVLSLKATPAITPNGDGIQDVWIIQDIEFFPNNRVVVVDRWGGIVYEASGYNNVSVVWTGTNHSGNLLPTGTYFYRIEIQQSRRVLTGSIELVR